MFLSIWAKRPHFCINCKCFLGHLIMAHFFAHIKSKGAYPELRLVEENIMLLCFICHRAYDQGTKDQFNLLTK